MMKEVLFGLLVLVAIAQAVPVGDPKDIKILRSENDNEGKGPFKWDYVGEDGSRQNAEGRLKKHYLPDNPDILSVKGSYSYQDTDGKTVLVEYEADEFGYRETRSFV